MYQLYGTHLQFIIHEHLKMCREWQTVEQIVSKIKSDFKTDHNISKRVRYKLNALYQEGHIERDEQRTHSNLIKYTYRCLDN